MRALGALLLLAVQLQPLWGVVLCVTVLTPATTGDDHCAERAAMVVAVAGAPAVGAAATGTASHGCPLADACTPSVVALLVPARPSHLALSSILPLRPADAASGLARLAPPTPPPNS